MAQGEGRDTFSLPLMNGRQIGSGEEASFGRVSGGGFFVVHDLVGNYIIPELFTVGHEKLVSVN